MRLLPLMIFCVSIAQAQTPGATYRVTFHATWSAATHPVGFPPGAHWSGLVGATHDATVSFWKAGETATPGIESMAERGAKTTLLAEIAFAGNAVGSVISGDGIAVSPGSVNLTFNIQRERPLVTLVSMVAPSPDWFVGVSGFDLREGNGWKSRIEAELHVYDAGTDTGATYTALDADTVPRGVIARLNEAPFQANGRLGTFVFELLSATRAEDAPDVPGRRSLGAPWPNPAASGFSVEVGPDAGEITLHDILGRVVEWRNLTGAPETPVFDVSGLPPGLYFVRIEGGAARTVVVRR